MRLASRMLWAFSLTLVTTGAFGADFTRDEVQSMLAAAPAATRPNFAGRSLAGLDLHDLDFSACHLSGADLSDADLRHTKLVGAKLVGAKLPRARLNLAWIMRADFSPCRSLRRRSRDAGRLGWNGDVTRGSCQVRGR